MPRGLSPADLADIHRSLALFAHIFDNRLEEELDLVFTEDVTVGNSLGAGYEVTGFDQARAFLRRMTADTADHNTLNPVVLVHEDGTVRVRSRYIAVLPDGSIHNGEYFDVLRFTPKGWRISYRMSAPRFPRVECVQLSESFLDHWRPTAARLPDIVPQ
ncbi:hypothetical protein GCM10009839_89510 [Catenulispora yoronensis]|uniref:SnoaL-like domain-containing protein n=1 Tax=Catenulispora yoronensis TaxID=450799 RepID=A0ABN2VKE0_9ACTN